MFPSLSVVIEPDKYKVSKEWFERKDSHYNHFFGLKKYEEETGLLSKHREPFQILIMVREH